MYRSEVLTTKCKYCVAIVLNKNYARHLRDIHKESDTTPVQQRKLSNYFTDSSHSTTVKPSKSQGKMASI